MYATREHMERAGLVDAMYVTGKADLVGMICAVLGEQAW